jgi:hypothetical protein
MTGGAEAPSPGRDLVKHAGAIMRIFEAFDLVGSYRGAAELAGCDHHTVNHYAQRRDAGLAPDVGLVRARSSTTTASRWPSSSSVQRARALLMWCTGTDRTTRRAVAEAKGDYAVGRRRVSRPWIPEAGGWLQFDWRRGPSVARRVTSLLCAWLAWSRFRVVIPVWDRTLGTTIACIDQTLRRIEGAPNYVLTDNEKTVTSEHVAGVPASHPQIAAAGSHYGVQVVMCVPADLECPRAAQRPR